MWSKNDNLTSKEKNVLGKITDLTYNLIYIIVCHIPLQGYILIEIGVVLTS
jgi:hypothetical protein